MDVIGVDTEGRLWGLVVRRGRSVAVGPPEAGLQRVIKSAGFAFDRWIAVSPEIDFADPRESDYIDINGHWYDPEEHEG